MGIQQAMMTANRAMVDGYQSVAGTVQNDVSEGAYIVLNSDGTITAYTTGSGYAAGSWYWPTTTNIGSGAWVRITYVSGDALDSGTDWYLAPGTWNSLAAGANIGFAGGSAAGRLAVYTIEIATDSGGSTIVSTGNYTFDN
jgi:hypothetical protein